MKNFAFAALAALGTFALPGAAAAQTITVVKQVTSDDLARYAKDAGHTVDEVMQTEIPLIKVTSDEGLIYYIQGNACTEGECKGVKFLARYDSDGTVTPERVNELNVQVPAVKLWYEEGVLALERYLILNEGILEANILYEIDTFNTIVPNVVDMFGQE